MTLHVFNPEHDMALAANLSNFTAPHAGRQLRADLCYLPALWAKDGDAVLVDNVERASRQWQRLRNRVVGNNMCAGRVVFVDRKMLSRIPLDDVEPWGWDRALCDMLRRYGLDGRLLPSAEQLDAIRLLSHRRQAAMLLQQLQTDGTVGEAVECMTADEVARELGRFGRIVLKAPWSSSGRGLRFCDSARHSINEITSNNNWLANVISRQGSVMVEPIYNKVKDFGLEFSADGQGRVSYCGLSLFHTANGAYTGNVLATENAKRQLLGRYVSLQLLDSVRDKIIESLHLGNYSGPFGIDMMVVRADDGHALLHPCVEINLRRTMGHAALSVCCGDDEVRRTMRIDFDGTNYKLRIRKL